jgi:adenylate cyclase
VPGDDDARQLAEQGSKGVLRTRNALRRFDAQPALVAAAKAIRKRLPGDRDFGDPLSVAGSEPSHLLGQRLTALSAERPSALREVGFSAIQVWQALSESRGRGRGDEELAILFTDLVGFSSWALDAGDTMALELLRRVGLAIEPPIGAHGGRIVKRLGDGLMAVFPEPSGAVEAALDGCRALGDVDIAGHRPEMRAGVHVGRPRKLGGDYFGVDVNVAARVAEAAGGGEVLVSEAARERLDDDKVNLRRRWLFRAKGAPKDLKVYAAQAGA